MRDGPRSGARWWAIGDWSLRWKVTTLVALPLAATLALGGMRITNELSAANRYESISNDVAALPAVVDLTDLVAQLDLTLAAGQNLPPQIVDQAKQVVDALAGKLRSGALVTARQSVQDLLDFTNATISNGQGAGVSTDSLVANQQRFISDAFQAIKTVLSPLTDRDLDTQASIVTDDLMAKSAIFGQLVAMIKMLRTPKPSLSDWEFSTEMRTQLNNALAKAAAADFDVQAEVERTLLRSLGSNLASDNPTIASLSNEIDQRKSFMTQNATGTLSVPDTLGKVEASALQTGALYNQINTTAENTLISGVKTRMDHNRTTAIEEAILLAIGLTLELLLAALAARSLLVPLRRLRRAAQQMADRDLPAEIDRIKDGASIDDVIMNPMPVWSREEVGQLARTVDNIHDQALRLAGEQAQLRLQVSDMFETLARRSKSLVDHQLGVIEAMEYEEKDPKLLEGLFRLDHLAARMRRNSDNLLILAGTKVRRLKAAPVEIGDVLRAAISEVEEYQRVKLGATPRGSLTEPAASDIAHLFAELLDNALRASPPETDVKFTFAQANDQGLLIEVADRGIGIPAGDLSAINKRLEAGAEISTDTARHMGLFVVSRLAERHGLTVRMRPTFDIARDPGVTVTVHVPRQLIIGGSVLAGSKQMRDGGPRRLTDTGPMSGPISGPISGEIRQVTRTPGGNMMITVDSTGDLPSLPQRHPGGGIMPDVMPYREPGSVTMDAPGGPPTREIVTGNGRGLNGLPQRRPQQPSSGFSAFGDTQVHEPANGRPLLPRREAQSGEIPRGLAPGELPQRRTPGDVPLPQRLVPGELPQRERGTAYPIAGRNPTGEFPAVSNQAEVDSGPTPSMPVLGGLAERSLDAARAQAAADAARADAQETERAVSAEAAAAAEAAAEARRAWEEAGTGAASSALSAGKYGGKADTVKTASFFQSRLKPPTVEDTSGIPIFAEMMSGWLADWQQGMPRPAFESIADEGWSAAQRVADAEATEVTESGLPQRTPGERLIPGSVGSRPELAQRAVRASVGAAAVLGNGGGAEIEPADDEGALSRRETVGRRRDPESVRASLAQHQAGVRNGRAMTTMKATEDEGER